MGTRAETTKKEKAILKFIETQVLENGYPPSVREIGKAIGLQEKMNIFWKLWCKMLKKTS